MTGRRKPISTRASWELVPNMPEGGHWIMPLRRGNITPEAEATLLWWRDRGSSARDEDPASERGSAWRAQRLRAEFEASNTAWRPEGFRDVLHASRMADGMCVRSRLARGSCKPNGASQCTKASRGTTRICNATTCMPRWRAVETRCIWQSVIRRHDDVGVGHRSRSPL